MWGYAHYAVFASVAALGAGLELAAESTRPGSAVWILPAVGGILAIGLGAGTLSVGAALPAMGAVVVGLVVVDRMAPGLHRTLTRLNSADASRFPPA